MGNARHRGRRGLNCARGADLIIKDEHTTRDPGPERNPNSSSAINQLRIWICSIPTVADEVTALRSGECGLLQVAVSSRSPLPFDFRKYQYQTLLKLVSSWLLGPSWLPISIGPHGSRAAPRLDAKAEAAQTRVRNMFLLRLMPNLYEKTEIDFQSRKLSSNFRTKTPSGTCSLHEPLAVGITFYHCDRDPSRSHSG